MIQLARKQLRALPAQGGLNLTPMQEICEAAFYAASVKHLRRLAEDGVPGPLLAQHHTHSTCLFAEPFRKAYQAIMARGARPVMQDTPTEEQIAGLMYIYIDLIN